VVGSEEQTQATTLAQLSDPTWMTAKKSCRRNYAVFTRYR
jgi:hypothetical protein